MWQNIVAEYQPYLYLLIGICLLVTSAFLKSKKSDLKQTGISADGIVFEQESGISISLFSNESSQPKRKVTVRFVTQDEQWITGIIDQDFSISYTGQYKNGDPVKVYYDKDNPSNFYVDTGQSELAGRLVCAFAGFAFIGVGIWKIFL